MSDALFQRGNPIMDVSTTAFTPINGAIAGVTPMLSGWQKVAGLESLAVQQQLTGTVAGTWTVQGSPDGGTTVVQLATYPSQPNYQNVVGTSSPVQPTYGFPYIQFTFTPSGGAGNCVLTFNGRMTSRPVDMARFYAGSVFLYCPAADTLAGQFGIECSNDWGGIGNATGANKLAIADGQWTDILPSPVIAVLVASTGQKRLVRMTISTDGATGTIEYGAARVFFTPTAGFGHPQAFGMFKG